jgi:hypothetical protein
MAPNIKDFRRGLIDLKIERGYGANSRKKSISLLIAFRGAKRLSITRRICILFSTSNVLSPSAISYQF